MIIFILDKMSYFSFIYIDVSLMSVEPLNSFISTLMMKLKNSMLDMLSMLLDSVVIFAF